MTIIECRNLSKKYNGISVLKDINLNFETGQVVGLFGANGSGKSTFLKILAGAVTNYKGSVTIDGHKPSVETKSMVSYMPEQFSLNERLSIRKIIALYDQFFDDFDSQKALNMINSFELNEKSLIKSLSKGMKEKLQISLTMSRYAKVYLFDEPLGGIDPASRRDLMHEFIKSYNPEALCIITTHLINETEPLFDRAIFIHDGIIKLEGQAETLRNEHGKSLNELSMEVCRA